MRVFVPVEDDLGDAAAGRLVPYRCGLHCWHALGREEAEPAPRAAPADAAPLSDVRSSYPPR